MGTYPVRRKEGTLFYYGELVRLRPPERSDLRQFVNWLREPELRHYTTMRYISDALEERWFEKLLTETSGPTPARLHFVIETREGGVPLGVISLMSINWRDRHAEAGIIIGEQDYWGKGYGTDAMRTLLDIGLKWYGLHRIHLYVIAGNERAIRSYEKCGFQHEGRLREAMFVDGTYRDLLVMSLLAGEQKEAGDG